MNEMWLTSAKRAVNAWASMLAVMVLGLGLNLALGLSPSPQVQLTLKIGLKSNGKDWCLKDGTRPNLSKGLTFQNYKTLIPKPMPCSKKCARFGTLRP